MNSAFLLAWRPFLDPIDVHGWTWALLLPLALLVAWVYKAVRVRHLRQWPREMAVMAVQVVIVMLVLAAGFYLLVEVVVGRWAA